MRSNLTARQLKFIVAYVAMPNATQAAREAGYSAGTAESQGSRLLSNVKIRAALDAAFAEDAKQRGVTKAEIVAAHRREMYNFVNGTPMSRIRAGEALSRLLGYDRFTVTVQTDDRPARHEDPELKALIRTLPPDKLKQFQEIMEHLMKAQAAKQIEHAPVAPSIAEPGP
jgi:terminase small subunit-like protein